MTEKIIIQNGIVLSMADGYTPIRADLYVEGDRIVGLDAMGSFTEEEPITRIDAKGCAVLPGLINTHTHTPMTIMRSTTDDLGFPTPDRPMPLPPDQDWRQYLTAEDHYWSSRLAIAEMIRTGTTTFVDMYHDMDRVAQAVVDSGVRGVLGWEIYAFRNAPGEWLPYDEDVGRRTFEESARFATEWHGKGNGRVTTMIAPHEAGTCYEPWLSRSAQLAEELDRDITVHVSESQWELDVCRERYGLTPVQTLEKAGIFGRRVIGAHNLYLTDEDIAILARANYTAASCIGSYIKLASEITPVPKLLAAGVNVGLGTDSAATNNNLNLWEEIYLTATLHGYLARDASVIPRDTALYMATAWGAKALGWEGELGTLEPGKKADLIIVDLNKPSLHPLEGSALLGNLQYATTGLEVRDVLVDGRILMRDGRIVAFDEAEVIRQVDQIVRGLRETVGLPESYSHP